MERQEYLEEIQIRIVRVTGDLRAIQRQLNCAAMEAPSDPELMEALSQLPEMDALQVLKGAVDQMRHFLWFYMQVMTNESESGEKLRQSIRQHLSADAAARPGRFLPGKIQDCIGYGATAVSLQRKKPKTELDSRQSTSDVRPRPTASGFRHPEEAEPFARRRAPDEGPVHCGTIAAPKPCPTR